VGNDGYMPPKPLTIYLQDHLAGSTVGVNLARRFAESNAGTPAGSTLAQVAAEIEADRETLLGLMTQLGVHPSRAKNAAAWMAERLSRLKPNGRVRGEPDMQRLHELETLSLGIAGKLSLWEALRVVPEAEATAGVHLAELEARARSQRERVETERMEFARAALTPGLTDQRGSPDSADGRIPASNDRPRP
jgi:hypothetical protein